MDTPPSENRRGFMSQAIALVITAVGLVVPGIVGLIAFLNPLRQKAQAGGFMRLATLDMLPDDGSPHRLPVIADRSDAWNQFPNQPIGAVFLRRTGEKEVVAFQVVCPHAGCSIMFEQSDEGGKFFCPCHAASFNLEGERTDATSPSPRNMDTLAVEIRNNNEVWVDFKTFQIGTAQKIAEA